MVFVLGALFGFGYCNFTNNTSEDTTAITFLYNDSFSGIMPVNPGENVVINIQNNTTVGIVGDNYSVFYIVTEDGFRHYNYSMD